MRCPGALDANADALDAGAHDAGAANTGAGRYVSSPPKMFHVKHFLSNSNLIQISEGYEIMSRNSLARPVARSLTSSNKVPTR
jgi:hypothetical protein